MTDDEIADAVIADMLASQPAGEACDLDAPDFDWVREHLKTFTEDGKRIDYLRGLVPRLVDLRKAERQRWRDLCAAHGLNKNDFRDILNEATADRDRGAEQAKDRKPKRPTDLEDLFTDAVLAERAARECLLGRYCRTDGLGWLMWNGIRWEPVVGGVVIEAVRQYVLDQYAEAVKRTHQRAIEGDMTPDPALTEWRYAQSAKRISAILSLAGNINGILLDAAEFDTHHDLLNTPTGVLDLRTDKLGPHDPSLKLTKVTSVGYYPEARNEAWETALTAVPEDSLSWLQIRLGQALTGYMPDDDRMILLSGGGSNGKTTVMDTAFRTLGGYAAAVPNQLLLTGKNPGGATPEKMTIRGVRLAYIEETPEDRHLDVTALKEVVGTPAITGRDLYKGFVTFGATHSLFLNTNHPPRVVETEEGTWRRLVRIDFPYRYLSPDKDLERETDRHGDPKLKAKLKTTAAREAALAWMVEGARRLYEAGTLRAVGDPPAVVDATRRWRHESDLILRYLDEWMDYDRDSWVTTADLYRHFVEWTRGQGHKDIPQTTFVGRLKSHTALPAYVAAKQIKVEATPGRSRPPGVFDSVTGAGQSPARTMSIVGFRYKDSHA